MDSASQGNIEIYNGGNELNYQTPTARELLESVDHPLMDAIGTRDYISTSDLDELVKLATLKERERVGWQPIETAPKDCSEFLAWDPTEGGTIVILRWAHPGRWQVVPWCHPIDQALDWEPTHWMPLPSPPKEAGS